MILHWGAAAAAAVFVASIASATAQTGAAEQGPGLSQAQRAAIYELIDRKDIPDAKGVQSPLSEGDQVPPSVQLYKLPDEVVAAIPSMRTYRFAKIADEVVIVDPGTLKVMAIIRSR